MDVNWVVDLLSFKIQVFFFLCMCTQYLLYGFRLLTLTAGWKGKPKPGLCVKVTVFGWLSCSVLFSNLV